MRDVIWLNRETNVSSIRSTGKHPGTGRRSSALITEEDLSALKAPRLMLMPSLLVHSGPQGRFYVGAGARAPQIHLLALPQIQKLAGKM